MNRAVGWRISADRRLAEDTDDYTITLRDVVFTQSAVICRRDLAHSRRLSRTAVVDTGGGSL